MTSQPRIETPLIVLVLSICAVVYSAIGAVRSYSIAAWPDRSSDPFDLRVGVEGDWVNTWEPKSGKTRLRVLWLDPPPWTSESRSLGADIRVRVEPPEAVTKTQGSVPDDEAGALIASWGEGSTPIVIDPPLVQSIHYRVERVDPDYLGVKTRLFVRGAENSEHPELAPVCAWAAALFAALGIVPSWMWLRSVRRRIDASMAT